MASFSFLGSLPENLKVGKKAGNLDLLSKAGFRVPQGFVVPDDFDLGHIQDAELQAAVDKIGGFPIAARSSANLEDLANASFAGQYETHLEIETIPELRDSILKCRKSTMTVHAQAYRVSKGVADRTVQMNVLVQKMVDAAISGVAFSIHPITGKEEHSLLECCLGLGEKLVSGSVTPSRYVIKSQDGSVFENEVGDEKASLTPEQIKNFSTELLKIQARFGSPQDIEWSIDKEGTLWILQSRPITQIQWRSDIEEYTTADFKDGGVSARVCAPLMYSLYREAMQESMPGYLKKIGLVSKKAPDETWIDCFYGRPYWNASAVKRAMTRVPGFDEKGFDADLGIQKSYGEQGPIQVPMSLFTILPAIPIVIKLEKSYKEQLVAAKNYGPGYLSQEKKHLDKTKSFHSLSDADFFTLLKEALELHHKTESDYFTTIYANSNYQSDFKKMLEGIGKATAYPISQVSLMGGLEEISHLDSQRGFVKLYDIALAQGTKSKAWEIELSRFIAENYFHGDAELDLSVPRWGEQPERIEAIVVGMLKAGVRPRDPEKTANAQKTAFDLEFQNIIKAIEARFIHSIRFKKGFTTKLEISRQYLRARETMREYSTRSYHLVRLYALEAGKRLKKLGVIPTAEDVLMLNVTELRSLHAGVSPELKSAAAQRKLFYLGYRDLTPPDELGRGVKQRSKEIYAKRDGSKIVLRGVGCSSGRVEGTVRVIRTLEEAGNLGREDILVTRFTDPGWTPVLGMVKGVVTEVGGLLSHAAVIGREFGIPAVLNLPGATDALKSGERVLVDGTEGTVEVL